MALALAWEAAGGEATEEAVVRVVVRAVVQAVVQVRTRVLVVSHTSRACLATQPSHHPTGRRAGGRAGRRG